MHSFRNMVFLSTVFLFIALIGFVLTIVHPNKIINPEKPEENITWTKTPQKSVTVGQKTQDSSRRLPAGPGTVHSWSPEAGHTEVHYPVEKFKPIWDAPNASKEPKGHVVPDASKISSDNAYNSVIYRPAQHKAL